MSDAETIMYTGTLEAAVWWACHGDWQGLPVCPRSKQWPRCNRCKLAEPKLHNMPVKAKGCLVPIFERKFK